MAEAVDRYSFGRIINEKVSNILACLLLRLGAGIGAHGANEFDLVGLLTLDPIGNIHIAGIEQMFGGEEVFFGEGGVNLGQGVLIGFDGGGRLDMR